MSSFTHDQPRAFAPVRLAGGAWWIVRGALRLLSWPARVMQARRDLAVLADLNDHELRDIGLTRFDVANATALARDADPTIFLARAACEAQARRRCRA